MPQDSSWWVTEVLEHQGRVALGAWIFWVIFSIVMHELSHGWAAIRAGDRTPIETGHMTWNPLVHMGPVSLVMFALIGIAWGAMPVNPSRFRGRYDRAIVALAGPAMNFSLFLTCVVAAAVAIVYKDNHYSEPTVGVCIFFLFGALLNFALMIFNLLPVPPLDGSRILANIFPPYEQLIMHPRAALFAAIGFILVFRYAGDWAFGLSLNVTEEMIHGLLGLFGHPHR